MITLNTPMASITKGTGPKQNGCEIVFTQKPTEQECSVLKAYGFRFSNSENRPRWYSTKETAAQTAFALGGNRTMVMQATPAPSLQTPGVGQIVPLVAAAQSESAVIAPPTVVAGKPKTRRNMGPTKAQLRSSIAILQQEIANLKAVNVMERQMSAVYGYPKPQPTTTPTVTPAVNPIEAAISRAIEAKIGAALAKFGL